MGYFEISSKRDEDADPLSSRVLIADTDINRISAAYAQIYFPNGVYIPGSPGFPGIPASPEIPEVQAQDAIPAVPPTYDDAGNMIDPGSPEVPAVPYQPYVPAVEEVPGIPGVPSSFRPPTGQEVFDAVAQGLLKKILADTIDQEKANAAKQAEDNIPPIPVDPGA